MTRIRKRTEQKHLERQGISYLAVAILATVISIGMVFAFFGDLQDTLSSMSGSNRIAITSIAAYTAGDRLVISGNIQNIGNQPLDSVTIDEITAGDLVITQLSTIEDGQIVDGHGDLTLSGVQHDGDPITSASNDHADTISGITTVGPCGAAAPTSHPDNGFALVEAGTPTVCMATVIITGISVDDGELESLAAGSSKSFRIVVTGLSSGTTNDVLDIRRTVPASTPLFMTVSATDGQTSTISDPRNVRVTQR